MIKLAYHTEGEKRMQSMSVSGSTKQVHSSIMDIVTHLALKSLIIVKSYKAYFVSQIFHSTVVELRMYRNCEASVNKTFLFFGCTTPFQ